MGIQDLYLNCLFAIWVGIADSLFNCCVEDVVDPLALLSILNKGL